MLTSQTINNVPKSFISDMAADLGLQYIVQLQQAHMASKIGRTYLD